MAVTSIQERSPEQTHVDVRIVDSDVHPVPRGPEFFEYIPEPLRSRFWKRRGFPNTIIYDAPDYAHAQAMRLDSFPEDGGFPGSDPDLTFRQLIMEAGSDIGILEPLGPHQVLPEHSQSTMIATNRWLTNHWLDGKTNWHGRWRGSVCVAIDDPAGAVREIEEWAEHPYIVQVQVAAEPRPAWGDPKYDPIWEAATRHGLPVTCHLGRGWFEYMPMPPVGYPSYNHDFMVTYSLLAANQVMSLVFDGVFERFPTMQVVLVEHAYSWILPLMWRMDAVYEARKADLADLKRKPSEYVYDHVWLTTQPLDFPDDRAELGKLLEWMEADRLLLFSSDYPHWTFDDPKWVIRQIPEQLRDRIMFQNGIELFGLPTTVPALEGQTRVYDG
jgi:predicted TIM-barrel fold metal-dependent hydrolase